MNNTEMRKAIIELQYDREMLRSRIRILEAITTQKEYVLINNTSPSPELLTDNFELYGYMGESHNFSELWVKKDG